jgi:hypothetical protein
MQHQSHLELGIAMIHNGFLQYEEISSIRCCFVNWRTLRSQLWNALFFVDQLLNSHPAAPNSALGLVNALNNHGSYVYLSDAEWVGLSLLRMLFFASARSAHMQSSPKTLPSHHLTRRDGLRIRFM